MRQFCRTGVKMRDGERTDGTANHEVTEEAAGFALVPLVPHSHQARIARRLTRPDPIFVTHLIATAAHVPQTRNLRRAAPSDALTAYTAQHRPAPILGCRTRQIV
jgi:hypothetical protein